ncbi:MAG: 2-oxoacid:acceptor oxidoreductase family protein [bacterium]
MRDEIRFSGFGGQGVILSGILAGKAAALFDNKHATMTQSFGPEARGSACSAQLVLSDEPVLYPYINKPNTLVSMSQDACDKFLPDLGKNGTLLVDEDLVKRVTAPGSVKKYAIPATRFAEELGHKILANLVMLGFFSSVTGMISPESFKKALPGSVPERYLELNLKAFDKGYQFGIQVKNQKNSPPLSEAIVTADQDERMAVGN